MILEAYFAVQGLCYLCTLVASTGFPPLALSSLWWLAIGAARFFIKNRVISGRPLQDSTLYGITLLATATLHCRQTSHPRKSWRQALAHVASGALVPALWWSLREPTHAAGGPQTSTAALSCAVTLLSIIVDVLVTLYGLGGWTQDQLLVATVPTICSVLPRRYAIIIFMGLLCLLWPVLARVPEQLFNVCVLGLCVAAYFRLRDPGMLTATAVQSNMSTAERKSRLGSVTEAARYLANVKLISNANMWLDAKPPVTCLQSRRRASLLFSTLMALLLLSIASHTSNKQLADLCLAGITGCCIAGGSVIILRALAQVAGTRRSHEHAAQLKHQLHQYDSEQPLPSQG
eukprot:TRINITY_DN16676_c0_g1_i1.p1 TRINITY_DN16676_c0_g1~~TRINITY_DN16676_c0_g1_i1.p1  ORF type:complete len:346 (-),score=54.70 TRINITY_DN16676_c0_g1_i1:970-2007(-)